MCIIQHMKKGEHSGNKCAFITPYASGRGSLLPVVPAGSLDSLIGSVDPESSSEWLHDALVLVSSLHTGVSLVWADECPAHPPRLSSMSSRSSTTPFHSSSLAQSINT